MKHVSEWSLALIAVTLVAAVVWWNVLFGRTDYEIKPRTETVELWGD